MPKILETKKFNYTAVILAILTLVLILRLLPLLQSPLSTYGYDYGFYLYAYKHATLNFSSFTTAFLGGYNSPIFNIARLLHLPAQVTLDELFFLCLLFFPLPCYWFYTDNKPAGLWAAFLAAVSVVQAQIYNMFLWKTALALPFFVLGFKFLKEKKWLPFAACSLVIILTHRTTAIIYFITLICYGLFLEIKRQYYFRFLAELLSIALLGGIFFLKFHNFIYTFLHNHNSFVSEGIFFENINPWQLLWLPLLLALFGIYHYIKDKQNFLIIFLTTLCLVWTLGNLAFSHRAFIYLDICLILFGAYGLAKINFKPWWTKAIMAVVIALLGYGCISHIMGQAPLITGGELQEIQTFRTNPPGQFVLASTANDAPWLLGFGNDIRLAAPGLFEDRFSYEEWQQFWEGINQKELLWKYPRPLYLYERSYPLHGQIQDCLKQMSANFYEYTCN